MASEHASPSMTEYIQHHLHHWQVQLPGTEGQFFLVNIDSVLFKLLAAFLFLWFFLRVRGATAGVPASCSATSKWSCRASTAWSARPSMAAAS